MALGTCEGCELAEGKLLGELLGSVLRLGTVDGCLLKEGRRLGA